MTFEIQNLLHTKLTKHWTYLQFSRTKNKAIKKTESQIARDEKDKFEDRQKCIEIRKSQLEHSNTIFQSNYTYPNPDLINIFDKYAIKQIEKNIFNTGTLEKCTRSQLDECSRSTEKSSVRVLNVKFKFGYSISPLKYISSGVVFCRAQSFRKAFKLPNYERI